jgi:Tetratricopeptide repeat
VNIPSAEAPPINNGFLDRLAFGPSQLADVYGTRGWLASATGKNGEAVEAYKRSLDACKRQFGNQHPLTGWAYLLLGKALAEDGNVEGGMKSVRGGLAILGPLRVRKTYGTWLAKLRIQSFLIDRERMPNRRD